jgi:hypothetical protein
MLALVLDDAEMNNLLVVAALQPIIRWLARTSSTASGWHGEEGTSRAS